MLSFGTNLRTVAAGVENSANGSVFYKDVKLQFAIKTVRELLFFYLEMDDWFKNRGYPHFTKRTPIEEKAKVFRYITSTKLVAKHSFSPLLLKNISQRRYKLSDFGSTSKRSHLAIKNGLSTSNTKIREILYATHIDAHIYSYYSRKILTEKYEEYLKSNTHISASISAYRQIPTICNTKFKNNSHFAKDVFDEIKKRENCVALAFDVENFFPTLNHRILKLLWAKILNCKALPPDHYNIFKAVTNFSFVRLQDLKTKNHHFDEKELSKFKKTGHTFFENTRALIESKIVIHKNQKHKDGKLIGIPQGLPVSALLANIYMLPFDEAMFDELFSKHNIYYRRYSDDIIVICTEEQVELVKDFVEREIAKIKLTISIPKTEVTVFRNFNGRLQSYRLVDGELKFNIPMCYLGFEFYGYQTLLKSKNLASFYRDMKNTVSRKFRQIEKKNLKTLDDNDALYKRKIYRLFSFKGKQSRELPVTKTIIRDGKFIVTKSSRKYRGNYIRYVYRVSDDMKAPELKRQVRNHWKILQKTISKFSAEKNCKSL